MHRESSILIASDDMSALSIILNNLSSGIVSDPKVITLTKIRDLVQMIPSSDPLLIILFFHNNKIALRELNNSLKDNSIPVLCLIHKSEQRTLYAENTGILFTEILQECYSSNFLQNRINSIIRLKTNVSSAKSYSSSIEFHPPETSLSRNLARYILELDQKVDLLIKIRDKIIDQYDHVDDFTRQELASIANSIHVAVNDDKQWEDFQVYFEKVSPNFIATLSELYPSLTSKDIKYCCYLKMNMSNNDISRLLGVNQESVRTHKYRLKQKMLLSKDQDLNAYLLHLLNETLSKQSHFSKGHIQ